MAKSEIAFGSGIEFDQSFRTLLSTILGILSVLNYLVWLSVPHFHHMYYWIMSTLGLEDYPESFRIMKGIYGAGYPAIIVAIALVGWPIWKLRSVSLTTASRWLCVSFVFHLALLVSVTYSMFSPIFVILGELGKHLPA